jgi:arabinofuranan 3-O-arabinosyltransferase
VTSTRFDTAHNTSLADEDLPWARRLGLALGTRLWPIAVLLGAVALVVCLMNDPGRWITDNRFEWYESPGRVLLRHLSLWDPSRGFGRERTEWAPAMVGFLGFFRALGASPALAERISHAVMLTTAGVGTVALLRMFKRPIGVAHVIAALFVMFNPYTAIFLMPSDLFLNYALAPWFALVFARGINSDRPWRWPAVFALLIFGAGSSNIPALVYALVPLLPIAVYYVHLERTVRWRTVLAWLVRAGILSLLVSGAALMKLAAGSASLAENLAATESARTVNLASSWSESWRGLGFWLSYWSDNRGQVLPQGSIYLTSMPVILATFAAPCIALATVIVTRWRARLVFAMMLLLSLALMVGSYPVANQTPFGAVILALYGDNGPLAGFRNSYKAGVGMCLGVGILFGVAIATAGPVLGRWNRWLRFVPVVGGVLLILVAAAPFWALGLYPGIQENKGVPSYWPQATQWLDRQPGDARVLVVPGTGQTIYRWGSAGDDVVDGLLLRPHILRGTLPASNPEAADVTRAIDDATSTGAYVPGTLAPIARRYGIRYVLIRNDLDWRVDQRVRPALLASLRADPDLRLVKTFGVAGEYTTAPDDHSVQAAAERRLPPLQIYEISGVSGPERVAPPGPTLLVSGSPAAVTQLSQDGTLAQAPPIRATGDLSAAEMRSALDDGSGLVVTDTNRRRQRLSTGVVEETSYTLGAGQTLGRAIADLFPGGGTQSVATFPAATTIDDLDANSLFATTPSSRPANAFDGDLGTTWLTGAFESLSGQGLRVNFKRPERLSSVKVDAYVPLGTARRVASASLHFSDGTSIPIDLTYGSSATHFAARRTRWVEIRVDSLYGSGTTPFGFREISFPGVDLHEQIQVPDDAFRMAASDPALATSLAKAPVAYSFERAAAGTASPEEEVIRRRFRTQGDRDYAVSGTVQFDDVTSDATLDALLDRPTGAIASARYLDQIDNSGLYAFDGRADTAWVAPASKNVSLVLHFPTRLISTIQIQQSTDARDSVLTSVRVEVAGNSYDVDVPDSTCAPSGAKNNACDPTVSVTIPPTFANSLRLVVTGVAAHVAPLGDAPLRIAEVTFNHTSNPAIEGSAPLGACIPGLLRVDGRGVAATVAGTTGELLSGRVLGLQGCGDVPLATGWHDLDAGSTIRFSTAELHAGVLPTMVASTSASKVRSRVISRTASHVRLEVDAPRGSIVLNGQSFDRGWRATVDGRSLGPPQSYDAVSGWRLPVGGHMIVDLDYAPDRPYRVALALTFVGLALCTFLVVRRRRRAS